MNGIYGPVVGALVVVAGRAGFEIVSVVYGDQMDAQGIICKPGSVPPRQDYDFYCTACFAIA